jgi:hypothetical protein
MFQVWMYVVDTSSDPDKVEGSVPWRVDEKQIFFGPCKKRIRECLRKKFLGPDCSHNRVTEDIFIIGVNAIKKVKKRKIVWWGRLSEVMTFAEANNRLKENARFKKMCNYDCSPLHVEPVEVAGELVGYKHASKLHKGEEWIYDLLSKWPNPNVLLEEQKLRVQYGTSWEVFDRDCCMLLENRFCALGKDIQPGIEFDEKALDILREAQRNKSHIGNPAIFGRDVKGNVIGLKGHFLEIPDNLTYRFIAWLEERSPEGAKHQRSGGDGPAKTCCY